MAYDSSEARPPTISRRGKRGPPPGTRFGGRQKGTLNKATVARQAAESYASEAIEALRSVCVDSSADKTARVQAACKLLDLLPSQLVRAKGALLERLLSTINGCLKADHPDSPKAELTPNP